MFKSYLLILLSLSLSIINIHSSSLYKTNRHLEENSDEIFDLSFTNAKNLTFIEYRWNFGIEYSGTSLSNTLKYFVSILYKGHPSLASCDAIDNNILDCIVAEDGQKETDLIQINTEFITGANIRWNDLTDTYDIAINTTLKYVNSYDLKYENYIWDFRIKITEDSVLPESGKVIIDLYYDSSTTLLVSSCFHSNFMLYCAFTKSRSNNYFIRIPPNKFSGSVEWENLENNVTIPLYTEITVFTKAYSLELINNQWTYLISITTDYTVTAVDTLITINTKIVRNEEEKIYFTKCLSEDGYQSKTFKCTVFGENQNLLDLVYITDSNINDVSTIWTCNLNNVDLMIIRNANLSFKRVYDVLLINKYWHFKIDIGEDELPNNAKVTVETRGTSTGDYEASCIHNNNILECTSSSTYITEEVQIMVYNEKRSSSVTWNSDLRKLFIRAPLNFTYTFVNVSSAFFTDKWNFMVFGKPSKANPKNSTYLIDIIQNNIETTAICGTPESSSTKAIGLFCYSNAETQSTSDTIKVNVNKKYGSITWDGGIDETNNAISLVADEEYMELSLTFKAVYDLYYANNKWFFTLEATGNNYNKVGLIKVDISVLRKSAETEELSTAICLLHDYLDDIIFLCSSQYENQDPEDLVKLSCPKGKTETSSITWKTTNVDPISIPLIASLTITDSRLKKVSSKWEFTINFECQNTLPLNSIVLVDVKESSNFKIVLCTVDSQTLLTCKTSFTSNVPPDLIYRKSFVSTITWTNDNIEDFFMIREVSSLALTSADYLYFDTENNKWNFNLTVSSLSYSKAIMDVLYGDEATTAICKGGSNYAINCVLNKESQDKTTLVKLTTTKSTDSTITWYNLKVYDIPLYTELTLDKVGKLKLSENKWTFDITIKDDIPENAFLIVDVEILRVYGSTILYTKKYNSIANCYHSNKVLSCTVVTSSRSDDKPYEFTPSLLFTKVPSSISSVYKWNLASDDQSQFILEMDLSMVYSSIIMKENDEYYFYIEISTANKIPYKSKSIIDIKIDTEPDTSVCVALNSTKLKCQIDSNKFNSEKTYYIVANKNGKISAESSITWSNLEVDQYITPVQLKYIYAYKFDIRSYTDFRILVSGSIALQSNLIFPVKLSHIVNGQRKSGSYERILNVPCKTNHGILFCNWYSPNTGVNSDYDLFRVNLLETGDNIQWENPSNDIINETRTALAYYEGLIYFDYDDINKYYNYHIRLSSGLSKGQTLVMDLLINSEESYGLCYIKNNVRIMECHTPSMEKGVNDEIIIKQVLNTASTIGIMDFRGKLTADTKIYPNNYIFVEIDKIYDLQFVNSKWSFKILPKNTVTLDGSKQLNIEHSSVARSATCAQQDTILNCVADYQAQYQNELIKLDDRYVSDDYIRLYNVRNYGIPLVSTLELLSSYDIMFNEETNEWSFKLTVKKVNTEIRIYTGSTFSVDIKCGETPELAFCVLKNSDQDESLNLVCTPQNEVNKETLISLSGTKTTYASVTWSKTLSGDELNIYFSLSLSVNYVSEYTYDETNHYWKFNIFTSNADLPINAKVKIDIAYNSEETTATCTYVALNQFECIPDVQPQSNTDTIRILETKSKGSVTFLNPESLNSKYAFNYVKAYNLRFESSKWKFDIDLANSFATNGNTYIISISVDDDDSTANCIYNDNKFVCEVNYQNQDRENIIKLVKYKLERTDITWNNFPDELTLYPVYTINFISCNGGFYEGKWRFNIYHSIPGSSKKLYNNFVLLDILVNDKESTAKCEITYSSFLKCISNHENQLSSDVIKIDTNQEPKLGSVTFNEKAEEIVFLTHASFSMKNDLKIGYSNPNDKLEIIIEGKLEEDMTYDLEEETVTKIKISKEDHEHDVSCITNNIKKNKGSYIYLTCPTELPLDKKNVKIKYDEGGKSNSVTFKQNTDGDIYFVE